MENKQFRLWDLPTRLFHWFLVLGVAAALVTGQVGGGLIEWHGKIGLGIVGLLAFRLVWGFAGSTYARFCQFVPTPSKLKAYLAGQWQGEGHNPLGALAVFGLLALLTAQVLTGLVANDDIAFNGPLMDLVGRELSNRLTGLHHLLSDLLIGLVVVHVLAIMYYAHSKKQNLLKPMLSGWQQGEGKSATGGGWLALLLALAVAVAAIYAASGVWLPPPPTPPALETPNW